MVGWCLTQTALIVHYFKPLEDLLNSVAPIRKLPARSRKRRKMYQTLSG